MTVGDLAAHLKISPADVQRELMKLGILANLNAEVTVENATKVAQARGFQVTSGNGAAVATAAPAPAAAAEVSTATTGSATERGRARASPFSAAATMLGCTHRLLPPAEVLAMGDCTNGGRTNPCGQKDRWRINNPLESRRIRGTVPSHDRPAHQPRSAIASAWHVKGAAIGGADRRTTTGSSPSSLPC